MELNRADVAGLVPLLPQLVPLGTDRRVARVDGLAALEQWVMPTTRAPVVLSIVELISIYGILGLQ
jgi:hypothetical protein